MIITHFPTRPTGIVTTDTLYEVRGYNLMLLPQELVLIPNPAYLNVANYQVSYLDSVSSDGTRALFRQSAEHRFENPVQLAYLATPNTSPRNLYTDYTYEPE